MSIYNKLFFIFRLLWFDGYIWYIRECILAIMQII